MTINEKQVKGFTLLELLIVIAILSVLAMALILILNPAESLKKSRDTQRMSDLATVKTAIGLYLTNITAPDLSSDAIDNDRCAGGTAPSIFYSGAVTATTAAGLAVVYSTGDGRVNGSGWLPIDLTSISSGSPISNFPLDPVNTEDADPITNSAMIYRYACNKANLTYEINANLESTEFLAKEGSDGGNNSNLYETGTRLDILGNTNDF